MWHLIDWINKIALYTYPILLLAFSLYSAIKQRDTVSKVGLAGSLLVLSSLTLRAFVPSVESIVLQSEQPADTTNPLIWFIYIKGANLGLFLVAASLCASIVKHKNV